MVLHSFNSWVPKYKCKIFLALEWTAYYWLGVQEVELPLMTKLKTHKIVFVLKSFFFCIALKIFS
jgi:hypothetical protein